MDKDKNKVSEYNKIYNATHKDIILKKKKEYREKNKEKINEYQRKYRLEHLEEIKEKKKKYKYKNLEYNRKYKKEHKENIRNTKLKSKYGITTDEYNKMFDSQNGCCAICNTHQSELKRKLCVDHDHKTGEIRGLLCDRCNYILGVFEDKTELFINAIKYLVKNK